jgi:hypothetical protein
MALLRIKSGEFKVIRYRANVITFLHGVQTEICLFCRKLFVVKSEANGLLDIKFVSL